MPCRASPPPPPPPHSSLDLMPSPAPLSNPLVYRLRTCCLQEFLPRVSIKQKRAFASSRPKTSCSCPCSSQSLTTPSTTTTATTSSTTVSSSPSSTGPPLSPPCCSSSSSSSSVPPAKSLSTRTRATENNHTTRPCTSLSPRPSPTQLSLLVQNNNQHTHCNHSINNPVRTPANNNNNSSNLGHYTHINTTPSIPWLPPMSNIQLSQLQSTLIHRFLSWSMTENNRVSDEAIQQNDACPLSTSIESEDERFAENDLIDKAPRGGHSRATTTSGTKMSLLDSAMASDMEEEWVETHELVWPEGDYYMAKKTFIREGVAHLRRGRRYIFVEPVLGPAASYLYPRWTSPAAAAATAATTTTTTATSEPVTDSPTSLSSSTSTSADGVEGSSLPTATLSADSMNSLSHPEHGAENGDENNTIGNGYLVTPHGGGDPRREDDEDVPNNTNEQDKDQNDEGEGQCLDENPAPGGGRRGELQKVQEEEQGHSEGDRVLSQNDESVTEDRASAGQPLVQPPQDNRDTDPASLIGGERSEKEDTDETMIAAAAAAANTPETTGPATVNSATATASPPANAPATEGTSSTDPILDNILFDSSVQDGALEDSYSHQDEPSLEPYSPLLDPTTDGQDQFEYGLYELQFIPKIQHLRPEQFLPTRQSFIVHLDEDRPTLASPVPTSRPSSSPSFSMSSLSSSTSQSRPLTRTECRCQLMMHKALMQQDLLLVWPPVAPIRTLQERLQDAEEEARMMEIKQKVQLQTMHWRKALMTQTVVCG